MTQEHPITPPPELVRKWFLNAKAMPVDQWVTDVATQAARWGADQELEACCADLRMVLGPDQADWLRSVRRPKPPSLKEQALEALENLNGECLLEGFECPEKVATIRRALESLPD